MTAVPNTASSNSVAAANQNSSPLVPKKQLSPDDFITLFLAQMKNQDPTNPTDSNQILQQMAEISSISSSQALQDSMDSLSKNVDLALGNTQVLQATQLIGKKVEVPTPNGLTPLVADEGLSGSVLLTAPATDVKVTIKDPAGNIVKTIDLGASQSTGLVDFKWDGKSDDGQTTYKPDYYQVSAVAVVNGKPTTVNTAGSFKVNSVALNQKTGGVILNVEGLGGINMGDIVKIF
jgi:flagellar basal-body rod modification protein FlgD